MRTKQSKATCSSEISLNREIKTKYSPSVVQETLTWQFRFSKSWMERRIVSHNFSISLFRGKSVEHIINQELDLSLPLFLYFRLFNAVDSKQMFDKSLLMTGFEPQISSVWGDRSTNWATITAQNIFNLVRHQITLPDRECFLGLPRAKYFLRVDCLGLGAIDCTLGNFSKPVATIILHKSPTILCNFCKGIKIFHFSSEIIFGQFI